MAKLKTIAKLAKLNNKLGLLDAGDIVGLASTAYKVKNFSPTDHLPDLQLDFWEREEIKKDKRRNAILAAAVVGTGAYLLTRNRNKVEDIADDVKKEGKKLARDARRKGEKALDSGKDFAEDVKDKAEDVAGDVADKADDLSKDAKKAGKTIEKTEVKNSFYDNY